MTRGIPALPLRQPRTLWPAEVLQQTGLELLRRILPGRPWVRPLNVGEEMAREED